MTQPQFQMRLTTVFAYTFVVAVCFAASNSVFVGSRPQAILVFAAIIAPPLLCIPSLFERALYLDRTLKYSPWAGGLIMISVCLYSVAMLFLSFLAFAPEWKGTKGMHWLYYVHDFPACLTILPVYIIGASAFAYAIQRNEDAIRSPVTVTAVTINALISFWYGYYCLFMRFSNDEVAFFIVPAGSGAAYLFMAIALWRRRDFREASRWKRRMGGLFALTGFSLLAKYPLAVQLYQQLPNEPPDQCFIVTAATRGHQRLVGTWYDKRLARRINRQLVRFWRLEACLIRYTPQFHLHLRKVYNRLGPLVAKQITCPWRADLVYVFLKPLEMVALLLAGRE